VIGAAAELPFSALKGSALRCRTQRSKTRGVIVRFE
jgi:hypothetical protein